MELQKERALQAEKQLTRDQRAAKRSVGHRIQFKELQDRSNEPRQVGREEITGSNCSQKNMGSFQMAMGYH